MNTLHTYTIEAWYRDKNFEKEFMIRDIIAESPEKAIELANLIRRNIFSVNILKKEKYVDKQISEV